MRIPTAEIFLSRCNRERSVICLIISNNEESVERITTSFRISHRLQLKIDYLIQYLYNAEI